MRLPPATHQILHCRSEQHARAVRDAIIKRLAQVGLELNLDKTRIVYCKDFNRPGSYEHVRFTFLGYTFRPRQAMNRSGVVFASFLPAVGADATKAIRHTVKRWRLHRWSGATIADLAAAINPIVRGWTNYYGGFCPSRLVQVLQHINQYLLRWAMRKYKRSRRSSTTSVELPASRR